MVIVAVSDAVGALMRHSARWRDYATLIADIAAIFADYLFSAATDYTPLFFIYFAYASVPPFSMMPPQIIIAAFISLFSFAAFISSPVNNTLFSLTHFRC